jgi:hypothetical protein
MKTTTSKIISRPKSMWILFGLGIVLLPAIFLFEAYLTNARMLWLIGLYAVLLISGYIVFRTQTRCKLCGNRIEWSELYLRADEVVDFIEEHGLEKPKRLEHQLKNTPEWFCMVATCKHCDIRQVSKVAPYDPG